MLLEPLYLFFFADSTLVLVASPIFPDILVSTHLRTASHQSDTRHKHDLFDQKKSLNSKAEGSGLIPENCYPEAPSDAQQ